MLELGGKSVVLQPAKVLEAQQRTDSQWFYGNLSIDLLRQAQRVTINFKTMTLKFDSVEAQVISPCDFGSREALDMMSRPKAPENMGSRFSLASELLYSFSAFSAHAKGDRTTVMAILAMAAALLGAALIVGQMGRRLSKVAVGWWNGPVATAVLVFELLVSIGSIYDAFTHKGSRRPRGRAFLSVIPRRMRSCRCIRALFTVLRFS
jgi:hypothetical protein